MEDRICFKKIEHIKDNNGSRTVKIEKNLYEKLMLVSVKTGISVKEIASKMLKFAFERTDIE